MPAYPTAVFLSPARALASLSRTLLGKTQGDAKKRDELAADEGDAADLAQRRLVVADTAMLHDSVAAAAVVRSAPSLFSARRLSYVVAEALAEAAHTIATTEGT